MTTRVDAAWARRWITLAAADVASHRDYLIDLDRAIGDGDHGENMDRGFTAALAALESAEDADISGVLKTVAKTLMSTVGGAAAPSRQASRPWCRACGCCSRYGFPRACRFVQSTLRRTPRRPGST